MTDDDSCADAVAQAADRLAPAPIEGNGRLLHLGPRLAHRAVARARCLQVTKAALDKLVDAWWAEHPDVGFTRIVVGECAGGDGHAATQLASEWDATLAAEYFGTWYERGQLTEQLMEADHLVDVVDGLLRCGASATIPIVAVIPRRPL